MTLNVGLGASVGNMWRCRGKAGEVNREGVLSCDRPSSSSGLTVSALATQMGIQHLERLNAPPPRPIQKSGLLRCSGSNRLLTPPLSRSPEHPGAQPPALGH
jgi:hypothetical protein